MDEVVIYRKEPFVMKVMPGTYAWCSCGRSSGNPFCDGSHKGTNHKPIIEIVKEEKVVAWCACKHSASKPYCDGSHSHL